MAPLLSLHDKGYTFDPIMQDGKVICLTVLKDNKVQLTIKDSLKVIPGALGKLAKYFLVATQKEHLPHYLNPFELHGHLTG